MPIARRWSARASPTVIFCHEGRERRDSGERGTDVNILLSSLSDPIWQVGGVAIVLAALGLILAVRTRDGGRATHQMRRDTYRVLLLCLVAWLVLSGGVIVGHVTSASPSGTSPSRTLSPPPTSAPTPLPTPTPEPSPTATPTLARSITQVLAAFCEDISARNYLMAWDQYTTALQKRHPEGEVATAWSHFDHCSVPDQSGDPSAWTILTLTTADGYTDRFGRSGDLDYRFTMTVENQVWKIAGVCEIVSEGCFAISWG